MTTEDLPEQGIAAFKAGHKPKVRRLLTQGLQQSEHNERAWLELRRMVDTDELRRKWLEKALAINLSNEEGCFGVELKGLYQDFRPKCFEGR